MERYVWYLPPFFALISALVSKVQLPALRGSRYLKQRDLLWAFWQFLDNGEFTAEGLALRRRYLLHALRFVVCGLIGAALATSLASR